MSIFADDARILEEAASVDVAGAASLQELEDVRVALLGKKGRVTLALKSVAELPVEERKTAGGVLNQLKQRLTDAIAEREALLLAQAEAAQLASETVDVTLPAASSVRGSIHPITQVIDEITTLFGAMGFSVRQGPLIEDDFHNFTALNIPESHPARQMHDTFYIESEAGNHLLRTHTSPVQIRTMLKEKPPIRILAPGATFRCDSDQTHTPMFHQVEGLVIEQGIHMGHLKGCLIEFLRRFFGVENLKVRFRPSFFPFTEPSAEVDIGCKRSKEGIVIGEGEDWLEVLGCGMVHPAVLRHGGIDPDQWQGFAFGMGVERLAMLKYNIPDLRTMYDSDVRWLSHYGFAPLHQPGAIGAKA